MVVVVVVVSDGSPNPSLPSVYMPHTQQALQIMARLKERDELLWALEVRDHSAWQCHKYARTLNPSKAPR